MKKTQNKSFFESEKTLKNSEQIFFKNEKNSEQIFLKQKNL
jgi:hypothetical protein